LGLLTSISRICSLALLSFAASLQAEVRLPQGFESEIVATGFSGATTLAACRDGRIFVGEQTGALRLVRHQQLAEEPVLTVDTDSFWERGLIGVTLAPDFPKDPAAPDPAAPGPASAHGTPAMPGSPAAHPASTDSSTFPVDPQAPAPPAPGTPDQTPPRMPES
jgi:hypothetical protein